jgi:RNA polymerase sigma-70 factor (ECF subfamily)
VSESPERELVLGLRRGERAAFDRAYELYRARIYGFLLRLSGRRDVADDLFQETFLALARSAPRLREDTELAAWLFTVARNEHLSWRRWAMLDLSRWVLLGEDDGAQAIALPHDAENREAIQRMEESLAALSDSHREVLLLVTVEGFDQERVGEMLGISYASVRQRLSRARAELQAEMKRRETTRAQAKRAVGTTGDAP